MDFKEGWLIKISDFTVVIHKSTDNFKEVFLSNLATACYNYFVE